MIEVKVSASFDSIESCHLFNLAALLNKYEAFN